MQGKISTVFVPQAGNDRRRIDRQCPPRDITELRAGEDCPIIGNDGTANDPVSAGGNVIIGNGNDWIVAAGNVTASGNDNGNDTVIAGGNVTLGNGNDTVTGTGAGNTINLGTGNDTV
jgi:hypothetical protein